MGKTFGAQNHHLDLITHGSTASPSIPELEEKNEMPPGPTYCSQAIASSLAPFPWAQQDSSSEVCMWPGPLAS